MKWRPSCADNLYEVYGFWRRKGRNMYKKNEIINMAKAQFSLDYNCSVSDFEKQQNTIARNKLIEGRRIYKSEGCFMKILTFCGRAIIMVDEAIMPWAEENLANIDANWLFQYSRIKSIDKKLNEFGHEIADMHHYYLPDPKAPEAAPLFSVKWFEQLEIFSFKNDRRFSEALCFDERSPDVLAVAACDGEQIMGMAGASADSSAMWQIGINVIPEYRGKGIGTNLTALLKQEILKRGKLPFYGTLESHSFSKNIAINAGFFPAWAEAYSKKLV